MNISAIFIKRPVMTTLITLWFVVISLFSLGNLPVNALPNIDFPILQVSASLSGASEDVMAQSVALPLQQAFSAVPGIISMNATNARGNTQIALEFDLSVNIDNAAQDVNTAITSVLKKLPANMVSQPTIQKINPSDSPILILGLTSDSKSMMALNELAASVIMPQIGMIKNVGLVNNMAPYKKAMRILLKSNALLTKKISIEDISQSIQKANANKASGFMQTSQKAINLEGLTKLSTVEDFQNLPIDSSSSLHLKDVASVIEGYENPYITTWFNQKESILMSVSRQTNTNAVEVAQDVLNILPQIQKQLPHDTKLFVLVDRTKGLKASLSEMKMTAVLAMALVIFVVFLFLQNIWATCIPVISIPLSMLLTFLLMELSGFSLNYLTLMSLILAIGFVIDDAIVVLENIIHKREQGLSCYEAALEGSKEISFTVLSMTLSLIAVFVPILFMGGLIGRLFFEFSMTMTYAILMSGVVSLTVIPALSRFMPEQNTKQRELFLVEIFQKFYEKMALAYETSLLRLFHYKHYVVHFMVIILSLNIGLYIFIPKGFFPNEDTGVIQGTIEGLPDVSFCTMKENIQKISEAINAYPYVETYNASFGASATNPNEGRFFIDLKEKHPQIQLVLNDLKKIYKQFPDLKITQQVVQNLKVGGKTSKSQYQYTLQSGNFDRLSHFSQQMLDELKKIHWFIDVNSDLILTTLKGTFTVNRDLANRMGIKIDQLQNLVQWVYGGQYIDTFSDDTNTYSIILDIQESNKNFDILDTLFLKNQKGDVVFLKNLLTLSLISAPLSLNQYNRLSAVTLSFNLMPDKSLESALIDIQETEKKLNKPDDIMTNMQGTAKAFQAAMGNQMFLLLAAIFTIYVILGVLYENFRYPLIILTGLPLAGIGALIFLWIFSGELNLIGIIGLIILMGIVKKNAIMMIDCARVEQDENKRSSQDAIIYACLRRFRPIMMTTFAAIMSAIPLALWQGSGAELRQPLGITLIGGLLISQWLTLFLTPLAYCFKINKEHILNALHFEKP
ncbi:MAG: Multidrug resistance protein MdtB [Holosporales bacterium]